ncbi:MAG: DUF2309 domain-containing protein [Leptospiraceae bacterium]|nr:DUF2309 domain-containing protein [Leptospiraceae bacterium]
MFKLQELKQQQQFQKNISQQLKKEEVKEILNKACKKIAPVWPLESFVAVNPYFGMTEMSFEDVAARLSKLANIKMALPLQYYLNAYKDGKITNQDIENALNKSKLNWDKDVERFIVKCKEAIDEKKAEENNKKSFKCVVDVASSVSKKDWLSFQVERISSWASVYFDEGQTIWNSTDKSLSPYKSWLEEAKIDRMPSVMGLTGFRASLHRLPIDPVASAHFILNHLGIPEEARDLYLHKLLLNLVGWSSYTSKIVFERTLYGHKDESNLEFLAILLAWEYGIYESFDSEEIHDEWIYAKNEMIQESKLLLNSKNAANQNEENLALVLQSAVEHSVQRKLVQEINSSGNKKDSQIENHAIVTNDKQISKDRASVQAIFCIDVRSEVYRRNLESVSSKIETLGFAGFFAFPIEYFPIGHVHGATQCPVLLRPAVKIAENLPNKISLANAIQRRSLRFHVRRAWTTFKMGAVSCFSFVGPIGLFYLPKLFTDGFGWTRTVPHPDKDGLSKKVNLMKAPSLESSSMNGASLGFPLETRIKMAEGALKAMSLTSNFAKLVLIAGHGSTTVNNPHATGLDCGACGGRTGESNAKVASLVLNDVEVRKALVTKGIFIPEDTIFLASQHDTTTDELTIFDKALIPNNRLAELESLEANLQSAAKLSRLERSKRMSLASSENPEINILARSKDWAQVRPEWGLAGCSAFIAAPRERTKGLDLAGKSFLHSYNWKLDEGYGVLELILTAPVVVASWISLQYYASTVDNKVFGSGNKTLHNVVSGIGVLEGNGGDLRIGLPWQSVHDGVNYQHEPVRLNVVIEAPKDAINGILKKHQMVKDLFDNGWLHLFRINEEGKIDSKYDQDLNWKSIS